MRRFTCIALCLIGCASAGAATPRPTNLPAGELTRSDGRAESLAGVLAGSVTVIDLWATWCTACELERPKLERLNAAYGAQGLRVIGLNVGESPSVVSAYLGEKHVSYPIYLDPDFRVADALGEKRLPTILVVDPGGRILHRAPSLNAETLALIKAKLSLNP
ncbi:MAG TPA: TlpA disulfide reductase family protein [Polyangiaceae bacterium]|nr:TlpA disulfide reductase family protein [Polyangiaceae bacterium]